MANLPKQKHYMFLIFCKQIGLNKITTWKNKYNSAEPLISCIISPEKHHKFHLYFFFYCSLFLFKKKARCFTLSPFIWRLIKLYLKFYFLVKANFDVSLATGIIMINLVIFICDKQKS